VHLERFLAEAQCGAHQVFGSYAMHRSGGNKAFHVAVQQRLVIQMLDGVLAQSSR
jgi:hypothetical protein